MTHSEEIRAIESGALFDSSGDTENNSVSSRVEHCVNRESDLRDTLLMTAIRNKDVQGQLMRHGDKNGRMVENRGIDSIRVVTPKKIRCHRCIIFLDWRSLRILTQATLLG